MIPAFIHVGLLGIIVLLLFSLRCRYIAIILLCIAIFIMIDMLFSYPFMFIPLIGGLLWSYDIKYSYDNHIILNLGSDYGPNSSVHLRIFLLEFVIFGIFNFIVALCADHTMYYLNCLFCFVCSHFTGEKLIDEEIKRKEEKRHFPAKAMMIEIGLMIVLTGFAFLLYYYFYTKEFLYIFSDGG